jgi:hypothetical protein
MSVSNSCTNQLPAELIIVQKIISLHKSRAYDFQDNWGTEFDWKIALWGNPRSSKINEMWERLKNAEVFEEYGSLIKQNISYTKYRLAKDWKIKLQTRFIETLADFIFYDKCGFYEIERI